MSDYLSAAKDYARLAEDSKSRRDVERNSLLATMFATLHAAQCQADSLAVARERRNMQREAIERFTPALPEFQFFYDDDPTPLVSWGEEADDMLRAVNEGKSPEVTKVLYRTSTVWAQVYPVLHV